MSRLGNAGADLHRRAPKIERGKAPDLVGATCMYGRGTTVTRPERHVASRRRIPTVASHQGPAVIPEGTPNGLGQLALSSRRWCR